MEIAVITLFPSMFHTLTLGVTGRALKQKTLQLHYFNPRHYTSDKHQRVDDTPYGGGPGMVMKAEPIEKAIIAAKKQIGAQSKVIYLSPQGTPFKQAHAETLSQQSSLILLCGRYEGIDERVIETLVDEEYSIGDYILTGGELPAMTIIDATTRLLPDVLGNQASAQQDSFSQNVTTNQRLLDHPHYTKPTSILGKEVPDVLLSGNHQKISTWRQQKSYENTCKKRPDLLKSCARGESETHKD